MKNFQRYLITAALPYANGPVHIGHLAGVYIPADIYSRYLRLKKEDVIFVCGSDEHGVPITIRAQKEGKTPQEIVDKYHSIIKNSFAEFGINFDIYSRTTNSVHYETASNFFKTIFEKNGFIEKTTENFFDEERQQFLADRYIIGTCPRCGNEKAYGDQCEKCGTSLAPSELLNPHSALSGKPPILKSTKHWYLPLDKFENFLKKWILEEHQEWKPNVYGQCKSWIDSGLQPRAVSRDLNWGVPLPIEEGKGKVLYVWFDAPIGYISATKELTEDWEKYWKSEDTKLVHFIGKDNIVFHCIIFPIMLKMEGSYILPENVPANEFLNLEGEKISTSQNWAVWLHEYLEDFPQKQDVLRYVLTANAPETKDNDFTWKDFQARNNSELVAVLGNFVNRAVVLTHKYFEGKVPQYDSFSDYDKEVLTSFSQIKKNVEENIENFHFREALKEAMNLARIGNKYLADTEPWKIVKTDFLRVQTILYISLQICGNLSLLFEPFLPFTAAKLRKMLNSNEINWENIGKENLLPVNHQIETAELLFAQIEDKEIEKQIEKLHFAKQQRLQQTASQVKSAKQNISYDDFQKIDIRVATVLNAEKVAKTKKLLQLTLDTGIDTRIVVSGIAESYSPEQLIGKQVVILVNLEPREIKGITSQGMILTAEGQNGELCLLSPEKLFMNGAEIK